MWQYITDEAKDLLRRLLELEPDRRIRIEEVLQHPWLRVRVQLLFFACIRALSGLVWSGLIVFVRSQSVSQSASPVIGLVDILLRLAILHS